MNNKARQFVDDDLIEHDLHLYGKACKRRHEDGTIERIPITDIIIITRERHKMKVVCYCGSLRVAMEAFKKAEYESIFRNEIALLPCCMFVDIQREYGADSDYKVKADELHKRKIDICDEVFVLNVGGYIGESTRSEINYALSIGKPVKYLEP